VIIWVVLTGIPRGVAKKMLKRQMSQHKNHPPVLTS
jgi:hypothetical protein